MSIVPYAKKVAGTVVWNQLKFIGKGEHWFRCLCEEAGLFIKGSFMQHGWLIIIFVICANADIFTESTREIKGSWGASKNRGKVVKALTSAVKEAERTNDIAYPETFKLFKFLFPKFLNEYLLFYSQGFSKKVEFRKVRMENFEFASKLAKFASKLQ